MVSLQQAEKNTLKLRIEINKDEKSGEKKTMKPRYISLINQNITMNENKTQIANINHEEEVTSTELTNTKGII